MSAHDKAEYVKLLERVARALYDDRVWDDTRETTWEDADAFQRNFFRSQAAAAIEAVHAS